MTNENHFPKTISQWEFDYDLFTNLQLLSLATFLWVHSSSKEVSYLSWHALPNLKTTCHIKLKFFLWTKLLENLLLAKYLISVATPLNKSRDAYLRTTGYYVSQFLFSFFSDKTFFSFFPFFHFCIISLLLLPVCLDVMSHANNFVLIRFFVFEI